MLNRSRWRVTKNIVNLKEGDPALLLVLTLLNDSSDVARPRGISFQSVTFPEHVRHLNYVWFNYVRWSLKQEIRRYDWNAFKQERDRTVSFQNDACRQQR